MSIDFGKIEILEASNNKKGDLFGRLMKDFFHSIGYEEPRLNIHKSGREIDLEVLHRTEKKIAIAECKAHKEKIGGADINKFIGSLDVEKRKVKKDSNKENHVVTGYFISLSGYKETAIEQEKDAGDNRLVLLDGNDVVKELINGRVLISLEEAIDSVKGLSEKLKFCSKADLVAFDKGWVWALYYSKNGQEITHLCLVHAEGRPLINNLVDDIIHKDKLANNIFDSLEIIYGYEELQYIGEAKNKYFNYLNNELGEIQFEGLPTDQDSGSVKVKLENIFVPLHFYKVQPKINQQLIDELEKRKGIDEILEDGTKLAILANPGGGKSTLIKRIAISYAFPERMKLIDDSLPEKDWFPIFIRCRELGKKVTWSISEIISEIPVRAEISECQVEFKNLISKVLQKGKALLLIDGLDEISEDQNRVAFVNQLRTFLATYPSVNIIVTSREAGFRVIGGSLAKYCNHYKVSDLNKDEIKELCIKWHKEIINDTQLVVSEAISLADLIVKDSRIYNIAGNPLLLTALLFVKRWVGYLPTKRNVLYQEMIKLLLVTWNVEGHKQLDIDEAEPQLSYIAHWMTVKGYQTITEVDLKKCLIEARKEMPEILGYTNISPKEFIKRVESRSSLLIMSGHKRLESGLLTQIYEFLHLSFQEYLTAKAIVKGYIPRGLANKPIVELLEPYFYEGKWREVIPIIAVLLGRESKELITHLINLTKEENSKERVEKNNLPQLLLGHCIASEVQINPDLLEEAITCFAKNYDTSLFDDTDIIINSKYGKIFRRKTKEVFFENINNESATGIGTVLGEIYLYDVGSDVPKYVINQIYKDLKDSSSQKICIAYLGLMDFTFTNRNTPFFNDTKLKEIMVQINDHLNIENEALRFCICWSLNWIYACYDFDLNEKISLVKLIIKINTNTKNKVLKRISDWTLVLLLSPKMTEKDIDINHTILTKRSSFDENDPNNKYEYLLKIYLRYILGEKVKLDEIRNASMELKMSSKEVEGVFELFFKDELKLISEEDSETKN